MATVRAVTAPGRLDTIGAGTPTEPRDANSATPSVDEMSVNGKRSVRPLGYYIPDSRLETQLEKALFKTNLKLLSELCNRKKSPPPTVHPNTPEPSRSSTPSTGSWGLSRCETSLDRTIMNNADYSKYYNRVANRVVSAGMQRIDSAGFFRRQRSLCSRQEMTNASRVRDIHCDVLGPYFCTDCTQVRKKNRILQQQKLYFPSIEVHARALVAPDKMTKLVMSYPEEAFKDNKKAYGCGCILDNSDEISTPVVYTQNDVYDRLRLLHVQNGKNVFGTEKKISPRKEYKSMVSFNETELNPMITNGNMKVCVKFYPSASRDGD